MRADAATNHGAALADGRGGISTAHGYPHGFSLADQEDGATMTTWAHLTELFSSLPWFKMRDPRGVARKFTALRAARRRASLHIKILSLSTFFGHGSASSFVYMFSLCAAIAAVSVRAGEAARSAAAAAPSTSTHVRRARALLVELARAAVVRDIVCILAALSFARFRARLRRRPAAAHWAAAAAGEMLSWPGEDAVGGHVRPGHIPTAISARARAPRASPLT